MDAATIAAVAGGIAAVVKALAVLVSAVRMRQGTQDADQLETADA